MIKLGVCVETVFTDLPIEDRIQKVSEAGYDCIEMWFHDCSFNGKDCSGPGKNPDAISSVIEKTGITINNMVINAPDGSLGGSLVKKDDRGKYLKRLQTLIPVAKSLGCVKAITCSGNEVPNLSHAEMKKSTVETLSAAAEIAEDNNFTLLLEPLNTFFDHPGYFLNSATESAEIIRKIDSPNLKLLYDIYHMQIMEGNLISFIEKNIDIIGHFHAAGVPGRHELFNCEINYRFIITELERLNYQDYFGLEYFPAMADQKESLKKTKEYLAGR